MRGQNSKLKNKIQRPIHQNEETTAIFNGDWKRKKKGENKLRNVPGNNF